jgi:hypothetical protein
MAVREPTGERAMPKSKKKTGKKRPKKQREIVYIFPTRRGNIDPRLIHKAVVAVRDRRLKEEAEAKTKAKVAANGESPVAEAE